MEAEDDIQEYDIDCIKSHCLDKNGIIVMRVFWGGCLNDETASLTERCLGQTALDTVKGYCAKLPAGRASALRRDVTDCKTLWDVFSIIGDVHRNGRTVCLKKQWQGYHTDEATLELEYRIRRTAPDMVKQYWESVGVRPLFVNDGACIRERLI